jgi:PucR C-terminal helix-turn-helix domain/GGDEF-like domain
VKVHNASVRRIDQRLIDWSERFSAVPLARKTVTDLEGRSQEIWSKTFDLLKRESPEYRNAVDDEFAAESRNHCGELLQNIIDIAAGRLKNSDPFAFVRRHAEWRARHQVPLVASLHAYRLAHKTYWGITREPLAAHRKRKEALQALAMLSDFWIELFEAVGTALEEAHAAEEARVIAQNTRAYTEVLDDLLNGVEPVTNNARQLLTLCGIHPLRQMTVVLVRPLLAKNGKPVDVEVATRSLVRLLHQAFSSWEHGKLVGLRNGEIVVIASSDTETPKRLIRHLSRNGVGRQASCTVGVGLGKTDIVRLPEALVEARMALELTSPSRALLHFAAIDLTEFANHSVDPAALRLIPEWVLNAHASGTEEGLLETIRTFADCNLHVKETARCLGVHTNTVYFRLNQIKKHTGLDPRTFSGTATLLTALRLLDRHRQRLPD